MRAGEIEGPPRDGREVSNRMVREQLRTARRRGYHEKKLVAGLNLTAAQVEDVRGFVAWDDYVVFLDRLQEAAGGPEGLEDFASDFVVSAPISQLVARQVVSPTRLCSVIGERIARHMYTMVGHRIDVLPDGRIRHQTRISPTYRGSLAFHHGSIGCLRAYPLLLGLSPALVEGSISPREAVLFITPPQSRTLLARALRAIPPRFARFLERRPEPTEIDSIETINLLGAIGQDAVTLALGRRLTAQSDLGALAAETIAALRDQHLCTYVRLFVRREPGSPLELIGSLGAHEPAVRSTRALTMGDQELGRLESDLGADAEGLTSPWVDAMLPWLALGLENCLRAEHSQEVGKAKMLTGLLPICAWCKKIRDDAGEWQRIESFVSSRTEAQFTHAMCPECYAREEGGSEPAPGEARGACRCAPLRR